VTSVREPDDRNGHVRFDEREVETELWVTRRRPRAKARVLHQALPTLLPPRHLSTLLMC
jgi:hypothetical protein